MTDPKYAEGYLRVSLSLREIYKEQKALLKKGIMLVGSEEEKRYIELEEMANRYWKGVYKQVKSKGIR